MSAARAKSETDADATEETQFDSRILYFDDTRWQAFQKALEGPVVEKPRLEKLLTEKTICE